MSNGGYKVSSWRGAYNLMYKSQIDNKKLFEQGELETSLIKKAENCKSIVSDRIASRDPSASVSINPYMVGNDYLEDLNAMEPQIDRNALITKYENFFKMKKLEIDKNVLSDTSNLQLLSTLAMLAPFNKIDKQAILESPSLLSRVSTINSILDLNTFQVVSSNNSDQLN